MATKTPARTNKTKTIVGAFFHSSLFNLQVLFTEFYTLSPILTTFNSIFVFTIQETALLAKVEGVREEAAVTENNNIIVASLDETDKDASQREQLRNISVQGNNAMAEVALKTEP